MNDLPEGTYGMGPAWDWAPSANPVTPQGANPQASSWTDILRYGLSKYADYRIAELQAQNTVPTEARVASTGTAQGLTLNVGSVLPLVVLGALAFMIAKA